MPAPSAMRAATMLLLASVALAHPVLGNLIPSEGRTAHPRLLQANTCPARISILGKACLCGGPLTQSFCDSGGCWCAGCNPGVNRQDGLLGCDMPGEVWYQCKWDPTGPRGACIPFTCNPPAGATTSPIQYWIKYVDDGPVSVFTDAGCVSGVLAKKIKLLTVKSGKGGCVWASGASSGYAPVTKSTALLPSFIKKKRRYADLDHLAFCGTPCKAPATLPDAGWTATQAAAEAKPTPAGVCAPKVTLPTQFKDTCGFTKTFAKIESAKAGQAAFVATTATPSLSCGMSTTAKLTDEDGVSFYQTYSVADSISVVKVDPLQVIPCAGGKVKVPSFTSACSTALTRTVLVSSAPGVNRAGDVVSDEINITGITCGANHTLIAYVTGCDGVRTTANTTITVACAPVTTPPTGGWNVSQAGAEANATPLGSCAPKVVTLPTSYTDSCGATKAFTNVGIKNATQTTFLAITPTPNSVSLSCGKTTVNLTNADGISFYQTYSVADSISVVKVDAPQVIPCTGGEVKVPSFTSACTTALTRTVLVSSAPGVNRAGDVVSDEINITGITCGANHTLTAYVTGCDGVRTTANTAITVACAPVTTPPTGGWNVSQAGAEANVTSLGSCAPKVVTLPTNYTDSCGATKAFTNVGIKNATQTTFLAITPTPNSVSLSCGKTTVNLTNADGVSFYQTYSVSDNITIVKSDAPQAIPCIGGVVKVPSFTSACNTALTRTVLIGSASDNWEGNVIKDEIFIAKDLLACGANGTLTAYVTGCDGIKVYANTTITVASPSCTPATLPDGWFSSQAAAEAAVNPLTPTCGGVALPGTLPTGYKDTCGKDQVFSKVETKTNDGDFVAVPTPDPSASATTLNLPCGQTTVKITDGIPPSRLRLQLAGKTLQEGDLMADYNVLKDSTLDLVLRPASSVQLNLKKAWDGKTITFDADGSDTVQSVLSKVQDKEGIPSNRLAFNFQAAARAVAAPVANDRTLASLGITKDSVISLTLSQGTPPSITITVKDLTGKTLKVQVPSSYTVRYVKKRVQDDRGLPPIQQRLIFSGAQLEDSRTIESYNLKQDDVVFLVLRLGGDPVPVTVKTPSGKTISLDVDPNDAIETVKANIQAKEGGGASFYKTFLMPDKGVKISGEPIPNKVYPCFGGGAGELKTPVFTSQCAATGATNLDQTMTAISSSGEKIGPIDYNSDGSFLGLPCGTTWDVTFVAKTCGGPSAPFKYTVKVK